MKLVLSIDGGGSRGVVAAQFLKLLEIELEKRGSSLHKTFDLYAGSSIGAMLVSPLAFNEYNGKELIDKIMTLDNIQYLFEKTFFDRIFGVVQLRPKYRGPIKRKIIEKNSPNFKIHESKKNLLVTGYNVSEHEARFFKSYYQDIGGYKDEVYLRDVLDVSTAAPSFFPAVKYSDNGVTKYGIDGAIFASDPSDCAYVDALKLWPDEEIRILSISLGDVEFKKSDGPKSLFWGGIQWLFSGSILQRITNINTKVVSYRMKSLTKNMNHKFLRIGEDLEYTPIDASSKKEYEMFIEMGTDLWLKERTKILDLIDS